MPTRPNILFIHTDSMDGRTMGCMGHPAMESATPNIDALARGGALFRTCYSNNPICCPSRASMWSGQWSHHCEGWNNYKGLEPGTPTFRTHLDAGGYTTHTFGKTDHLSGRHSIRARVSPWTRAANIPRPAYRMPGPQVFEDDRERVAESDWADVGRSIEWMREHGADGRPPFFLFLGIRRPHPPFVISRRYMNMIDADKIALPAPDEQDHPVTNFQRRHKNWIHGFDEDTCRLIRHIYCAMIAEVDAMVGRTLAGLDDLGLAEDTWVLFSSDHGEMNMEHRQFYKMSPYEPSARVPMILRGPGARKGAVVEDLVSLVDVYPSLMDMAGLPHPGGLDGHSLGPLAKDEPCERPDWVLSEFHGTSLNTGCFMLRRGAWKYIVYVGYPPQLFNLDEDPAEIRDLASQRPDVVADMDRLLRSIVDYEAVDAKVKAYDKRSFIRWREEQLAAGTYEATMAHVFSGFDCDAKDHVRPWTEEDEARIDRWLEGRPDPYVLQQEV